MVALMRSVFTATPRSQSLPSRWYRGRDAARRTVTPARQPHQLAPYGTAQRAGRGASRAGLLTAFWRIVKPPVGMAIDVDVGDTVRQVSPNNG